MVSAVAILPAGGSATKSNHIPQEKSAIAKEAERVIAEIKDGSSKDGGLFKIFGDDYVPSIEWEAELVPVLMAGLKIDNHSVQFSIDRIWHKVTGVELINVGGGTFETISAAGKKKVLEWLEKWWAKYKDASRVDWYVASLSSGSLTFRRMAIERLSMMFNKSFGYEAEAEPAQRTKAVEEWTAWWEKAKKVVRWDAEQACYAVDETKLTDEELKKLAEKIRPWIDQLGDPDFDVREKATERLIEAGRSATAALKEAAKSTDAEVRFRAQLILEAQTLLVRRRDIEAKAAEIQRGGDVPGAIAELAAKKDVGSAAVIVEVCFGMAPAAVGEPAAKRAASDPNIAWTFARRVRRASADGWQGANAFYASDATRALFSESAALLVPYLKDASPRVRMAAATVIASRGAAHADAVKAALADTDKRVRLSAIQALGQSRDTAAAAVVKEHYKTEKDYDNRRWAVLAVGRLKDEASFDWLAAVCLDTKEHLFATGAAAEAIGMIGSPKGIATLVKLLDQRKGDLAQRTDDYSRRYVLNYITGSIAKIALAHADDKESWKALEAALAHETNEIRELTAQALAYHEVKGAPVARVRELLQGAAADKDAKVRQVAEMGLRRWK
jgi:HEAT repeat protein